MCSIIRKGPLLSEAEIVPSMWRHWYPRLVMPWQDNRVIGRLVSVSRCSLDDIDLLRGHVKCSVNHRFGDNGRELKSHLLF